jgi:lipopolysaccharide biosynthesis glycosyltransferase
MNSTIVTDGQNREINKAVVTIAIGEAFQKLGKITHPIFKNYAERNNADLIVIDKQVYLNKFKILTYEKLQVWDLLDGRYDQILLVDTDVLIAPDAPSVFEMCPTDTFGFVSEETYSMAGPHKKRTQEKLGRIFRIAPYFNSGVMVFSPIHREIFNPQSKIFEKWALDETNKDHIMSDQPVLNYLVNYYKFKTIDFGYKFNHTRVIPDPVIRFRSYFIHYTGEDLCGYRFGTKVHQIEKDAGVLKSPVALYLSRIFPMYRWVMDRCDIYFLKYFLDKIFKTNFYK